MLILILAIYNIPYNYKQLQLKISVNDPELLLDTKLLWYRYLPKKKELQLKYIQYI